MRWFAAALVLAVSSSLTVGAIAADKPEKKEPEAVFKKLDKDSDGKVSLEEFVGKKKDDAKTKAEEAFKKKDKDKDGFLSLEEFKGKAKKDK